MLDMRIEMMYLELVLCDCGCRFLILNSFIVGLVVENYEENI